jgi:hypothetical protein
LEIILDEMNESNEEDSVVPNQDIKDQVQWRTNPITSDINTKMPIAKIKLIKATKSLPAQSNIKKRRQTVRRMV